MDTENSNLQGAMPDTVAAARHLLRQWSSGEVKYYSKAPALGGGSRQTEATNAIWASALDGVCLPRRPWRAKWGQKELRLKQEPVDGSLANQVVQFDRPSRSSQVRFTSDQSTDDERESGVDAQDDMEEEGSWDDVEVDEDQSNAEDDAQEVPEMEGRQDETATLPGGTKAGPRKSVPQSGGKSQPGGTYRFADHF